MNTGSLYAPRDQPEKERERERERERMIDTGRPSCFDERGSFTLIQKGLLYLYLYIEGNERCKVIQSQPKHSSSFALIETRVFLHTFPTNDVMYIIFWPWRPVNIL